MRRDGSLLLEALIAIGIFSMFLAGAGLALLGGEASTVKAGDHARATFLASEQLEILRYVRDDDLQNLSPGVYGVQEDAGTWSIIDEPVQRGGFLTSIDLTAVDDGWLSARSHVSWNFGKNRSGSVLLHTYLTDWQEPRTVGNWSALSTAGTLTLAGTPDLRAVVADDSYAFLGGTTSGGGPGLFIVNVSNPALPVRVASSFNLGAGVYGLAIVGDRLYLATDDPSAEVQVFDIASPSTLALTNIVNSYDLPGSGRARAIAVYGDTVYVGATESPPEPQFYALRMSETGPMTLLDALDVEGGVTGISLLDGYAYLSTTDNAGELKVVDTFDPSDLSYAPDEGVDLSDVYDATLVHAFGTSAVLGRIQGSSIAEFSLYDIASTPVPTPPPGPWTLELAADVHSFAVLPGLPTAFIGSSTTAAQLRVIDLAAMVRGTSSVLTSVNVGAAVLGLWYDVLHDRLLAVTSTTLRIFTPG